MSNPNIKEMQWEDASTSFKKVNSQLAEIIEGWNPGFPLYKVSYQYGDKILENGILNLPLANGTVVPITHHHIDNDIRQALDYNTVPLGVITKNAQEVFLEKNQRVISLNYFEPGIILGLWENLDTTESFYPRQIWSVSAGARNCFLLPKIAEAGAHQRLCKTLGFKTKLTKNMTDHFETFKAISRAVKSDWRQEIIFFSKEWLEEQDTIGWTKFKKYLFESGWGLSKLNRNMISFDQVWDEYLKILDERHHKPAPHILEILHHIVNICIGVVPAFRPVDISETAIPARDIIKAYKKNYELKNYYPSIMQPWVFNFNYDSFPVYYSLQYQTNLHTTPKRKHKSCLIDDLRDIKTLIDYFYSGMDQGDIDFRDIPFKKILDKLNIDFIHADKDVYNQFLQTENLAEFDSKLIGNDANNRLATNAAFFKGCVRISRKES